MIVERYGLPERALKLDGLKRALGSHRTQVRRDLLGPKGVALAHSRRLLRQSRARIDNVVSRNQEDWKVIGAGMRRPRSHPTPCAGILAAALAMPT